MADIREYQLELENVPGDVPDGFFDKINGCMGMIFGSITTKDPNLVITEDIYRQTYEKALFVSKLDSINLDGVFKYQNITDPKMQAQFATQVKAQLSTYLNNILEDPALTTKTFHVDDKKQKVTVDYADDDERVTKYFTNTINVSCVFVWDEIQKTKQLHVDTDTAYMIELYNLSKSWKNDDEKAEGMSKFAEERNAGIIYKYIHIINLFGQLPFNEIWFRKCVDFWYLNGSSTRREITMKYFKMAVRKDSHYTQNMQSIAAMVDKSEASIAAQKTTSDTETEDDSSSDDGEVNPPPAEVHQRNRRRFYESFN